MMFYDEGTDEFPSRIVCELNSKETNYFFYRFSENSDQLSLVDYVNHYRFMKEEVLTWMKQMIGPQGETWGHGLLEGSSGDGSEREIWFADKGKAAMFKMFYSSLL